MKNHWWKEHFLHGVCGPKNKKTKEKVKWEEDVKTWHVKYI